MAKERRRLERLEALEAIIVGLGYEIVEGEFIRKDGSLSPVYVWPKDSLRILKSAEQAILRERSV